MCSPCEQDSQCDDALYCNGVEACAAGECFAGTAPICEGDTPFCSEYLDRCVECLNNADCADGVYCNGAEVCAAGVCSAGSQPCPNEPLCDEANDRCFECVMDADCDDDINCNGEETCSANVCVAGSSTCSNDNVCDEANDQCVECLVNGDCVEGYECLNKMCILLGAWTWMSGANTISQSGVYGTQGVPDAANVPGARDNSISWTDNSGNLWLFGGYGFPSVGLAYLLNDLWHYEPDTGMWTWMSGANTIDQRGVYGVKGVAAATNVPGARSSSISWTDSFGNLWLFGGWGYDSTSAEDRLNDLWHYEPDTGMWTWTSGANTISQSGVYGTQGVPDAANVPGARDNSISWTDREGNLWLFGGRGYDSAGSRGNLNDLWTYNISTNQWTWMSGANTRNQGAVYGTKGTPAIANMPGARTGAISWTDSAGNLWLFGGTGYTTTITGYLNDLWRYDPSANMWTWVSGANTASQVGVYGTKGVPDDANVPGARTGAISWTDSAGNLWLFGGFGYSRSNSGTLDDLWRYDPSINQWTWMSGSDNVERSGVYGTKGVPSVANNPGALQKSIFWTDGAGNLWLFGGYGRDSKGNTGYLNALWRYERPQCLTGSDCSEGYECVEGECLPIVVDNPPVLGAGPYLAAGYWPVLPTSAESPMYLDHNNSVLWTFSDDFASCSGDCTHAAEYQPVGGSEWTAIDVTANAAKGYAYVTLPVESLQNATTYAFRYSVTDCASQTTQSQTYYFRVAITDAPPVIKSGPFLAAGAWPVLATSSSLATVLNQNEYVLWTFSDDYAFCSGLCTHRARYKKVDDTVWTWITPVSTDTTGKKFAYTELPVESLTAGTYYFYFDVRDCAGQLTKASKVYYFKVE